MRRNKATDQSAEEKTLVLSFFFFFFFFFLPSTSLWGFYSETFIHHYSISLTHAFTRLCMIFVPHMYILHYNYYNYNYNNY